MDHKETKVWKSSFESSTNLEAITKLTASYDSFFSNASALASQISKDLPDLTLHDEQHFNALWRMVDLIVEEECNLNPLELYILGGAILLHDTANTVAAYEGGIEELKQSPQWLDTEAEIRRGKEVLDSPLTEAEAKLILLFTLRDIHAERAAEMHEFKVEVRGSNHYLIEDSDLRSFAGELIGRIAASHHWNVEDLSKNLRAEVGPPPFFPPNWKVRPVLLACILRCADACQIDASRAPAFLQGILKPSDGSVPHWNAQGKLNTPTRASGDAGTLVFTSTNDFTLEEAKAWWIANDLIKNADKELSKSDALLRDLSLPALAVRRIAGAESPSRLSSLVRVSGWHPVDAKVQVSDVARVVDLFGGSKLYGHSSVIPLRELIQNGVDAVRLRRALDHGDTPYKGRVTVRIRRDDGGQFLEVDDDGIGMSQGVLTGPLIDFSSSYLTSSIAKREYPGLIGKKVRRSGRFGVGFFSVFMLSDNVEVTSRRFDDSPDNANTLKFEGGLATRPLLIERRPTGYSYTTSTRVKVPVSDQQLESIRTVKTNGFTEQRELTSLAKVIAYLVPLIDVDIYLDEDGNLDLVHSSDWYKQDAIDWLDSISLEDRKDDSSFKQALLKIGGAVEFIDSSRPHLGRAVIAPMAGDGIYTVDGLSSPKILGQNINEICGVIDRKPNGPQRNSAGWVDPIAVAEWASRQALSLASCDIDDFGKFYAASRVAKFGGDATPLATMLLNGEWKTLEEVYGKLKTGDLYAPIKVNGSRGGVWQLDRIMLSRPHVSYGISRENYQTKVDVLEAPSGSSAEPYLNAASPDGPNSLSFMAMISRITNKDGLVLVTEGIGDFAIAEYTGEESKLEKFFPGMEMKLNVLKISLVEEKNGDTGSD